MSPPRYGRHVCAVVVTYHPDPHRLAALLRAVAPQVSSLVVVDNGSEGQDVKRLLQSHSSCAQTFIQKPENVGLAAAQNEGIEIGLRSGAEHILLLDDDSVPEPDMVARLLEALESLAGSTKRIAAAGPVFKEEGLARVSYFVRFGMLGRRRVFCSGTEGTVGADLLISSGMLIPATVLKDVGIMDSSLFVDHVDTEWCLRARGMGYALVGVCGARMLHQLGERSVELAGGRRVSMHSVVRRYFMYRNSVLLYRRAGPPLRWKISDAFRMVGLLLAVIILSPQRFEELRAALIGVRDGVLGRSGPAPQRLKGAAERG